MHNVHPSQINSPKARKRKKKKIINFSNPHQVSSSSSKITKLLHWDNLSSNGMQNRTGQEAI
jgi:hypothetical protein